MCLTSAGVPFVLIIVQKHIIEMVNLSIKLFLLDLFIPNMHPLAFWFLSYRTYLYKKVCRQTKHQKGIYYYSEIKQLINFV